MKNGAHFALIAALPTCLSCASPRTVGRGGHPSSPSSPAAASLLTSARSQVADALSEFESRCKPPSDGKADEAWEVRMKCLVTLAREGPAAAPVIIEVLRGGRPYTRAFAAQALGIAGDDRARSALVKAVEDRDPFVRLHAIRALGRMGGLEATPERRQIAEKDDSDMIRFEMKFALGRDDKPESGPIREAVAAHDLSLMGRARLGQ